MVKKKKINKKKSYNRESLTNSILGIFSNNPTRNYNYKQLASLLNIKDPAQKNLISSVLYDLTGSGNLTEIYTGKFRLKSKGGYVTGSVEMNANGSAYIHSEALTEKVYISQAHLNRALQGDSVKVLVYAKRKARRLEGEVVEVLERTKSTFVGILEVSRNYAFLVADNRHMPYDIFIPLKALNGAKGGQKVIARITEWPKGARNPVGEVVEVLGKPGNHEVEMHAILAEFDLPYRFPDEVEQEAERLPDTIPAAEYKERRDFRQTLTFTIDPADAKDFDDALSLKPLGEGLWEVGVHIADVSHYIKPKTTLDREAYERGTSVYLVDRVVPMLPEKLSNDVCSLNPQEDKLCFSAVFNMNDQAEVISQWFGKTIIRSQRRFNYDEVQRVIETGRGDMRQEILVLHRLAQKLRQRRFQDGSFGFDRVEIKFNLDEKGNPISIFFKENKESNQLIEEFMLLANRRVAELVGMRKGRKNPRTFVYRVHDKPNHDKLESLSRIVRRFGHRLALSEKAVPASMNKLLSDVKGKKEQDLIETLAIRSMAKAKYSVHNIGHYGLGFRFYTHFTSPIRRYPDLMVHRLLDELLKNKPSRDEQTYENRCVHASVMEQKAADAEWASVKYKQVEFMQDKLGEQFEGIISGVAEWGLYVEIIENKCEGLVPIRELDDDFYEYDEDNYCLRGRRNRKVYQLGDPIRIEIYRTNLAKRQLDFRLAPVAGDE